jgi:arylsulfatase A-like enzyme
MRQFTNRVMPNTMRLLMRHGTKFTDYIATTAQCCPSRASLLTGQYAHNHG